MWSPTRSSDELYHHGILGMKWGVRRFQNPDGTLTAAGRRRLKNLEPKKSKYEHTYVDTMTKSDGSKVYGAHKGFMFSKGTHTSKKDAKRELKEKEAAFKEKSVKKYLEDNSERIDMGMKLTKLKTSSLSVKDIDNYVKQHPESKDLVTKLIENSSPSREKKRRH